MAKFPGLRPRFRRTTTDDAGNTVVETSIEGGRKSVATVSAAESHDNGESPAEAPSQDLQRGVQDVEGVTLAWSKTALILVFLKYVLAITCDKAVIHSTHVDSLQHLASLFCERFSVVHPIELTSVRYKRLRVTQSAERHIYCRICHVSCGVHSSSESHGHLGPS